MKRGAASVSIAATFAFGLLLILAAATVAAGPTRLTQGTVTPTMGTTADVFAYSVHYVGNTTTGETAISVTAEASNGSTTRNTSLALFSGSTLDGVWTGSTTLPAGSWMVTFKAIGSLGSTPSSTVISVVVIGPTPTPVPTPVPPPPTPGPTPRPTVRPTPRPTAGPATPTPVPGTSLIPGPTPFGTTITDPSNSPGDSEAAASSAQASPSPSPSPAGAGSPGRRPFNVPVEGVVAIGLLAAVTVAAALGERRRRRAVAAFRAGLATSDDPFAPPVADDLQDASDVVDDETVATIDYEGLDDGPDA